MIKNKKMLVIVLAMCGFSAVAMSDGNIPKSFLAVKNVEQNVIVAQSTVPVAVKATKKDLVLRGDAKCTECHDETDNPNLLKITNTKHGTNADGRTPTCTDCHGDDPEHIKSKGDKPNARIFAKGKNQSSAEERSAGCTNCHTAGKQMFWDMGAHAKNDIACSDCHSVHNGKDLVMDKITQTEVCYGCHKEQRAEMQKISHHPVNEGKVACSDCHNVHGTLGEHNLVKDTINETCHTCHAEKRGPFVHNHEPVMEDCAECHKPHGTTTPNLLSMRAPALCHQCHSPHGGNALPLAPQSPTATGVQQATTSYRGNFPQGRACLSCHTQIHGSNNPAFSDTLEPQFMLR